MEAGRRISAYLSSLIPFIYIPIIGVIVYLWVSHMLSCTGAAVSGGITYPDKGAIMRIVDHISLVPSPLRGGNCDSLGVRFPDMTKAYDERLGSVLDAVAQRHGIDLKRACIYRCKVLSLRRQAK